ncbi:type II toxin-antitoxin system RatA family toxin [Motilibacter deserti]|uniref:Cyclase n=1 Tax=Motilibacter deserti TaxID=2714956 RepID=A0ABX0GZT0_9ACTN|nr:aromatase/cyclase [Motilibacter deserti]NHC16105.1 cyclase [Motilibacter deserti]
MPTVDVEMTMHAPVQQVWDAVVDVESYPRYMETVKSVKELRRLPDGSRETEWSVLLKGSTLEWVERDVVLEGERKVVFEQTDGDLEVFEGEWTVTEQPDGTVRVRLFVNFDIGIPLLSAMLNPVAERALKENSRTMLQQIEKRVAA